MIDGINRCAEIAGMSDNDLVRIEPDGNFTRGISGWPTYDDDKVPPITRDHWVVINRATGMISVKFDTRFGMIYPHELLDYTKQLGAGNQKPIIFEMPRWFDWDVINTQIHWIGERVEGGDGGEGGLHTITIPGGEENGCLRNYFVEPHDFPECTHELHNHPYCSSHTCGNGHQCCWADNYVNDWNTCNCKSSYLAKGETYYNGCVSGAPRTDEEVGTGGPSCGRVCNSAFSWSNYCQRTGTACVTSFDGQFGGDGATALVCHLATPSSLVYVSSCDR